MLVEEWANTKETIVLQLVVQIVADREPTNRTTRAILEGMYKHIPISFCKAHCLNNLLKDIGALTLVMDLPCC